jgi:hypothetical protein
MKLTELRKVIREEVKAAIQEELKDILLEAVRSPKSIVETTTPQKPPNPEVQKAFRDQMMTQMVAAGNGDMNLTSKDVTQFQVPPGTNTSGEGSSLPAGNVGLDQIMGLMKGK